jgi:CDP-glucose 4,6-dehydratase
MAKWESTMENVGLNNTFWRGKNVFVTGHTGFKGGWLCIWLNALGAKVHGYALNPPKSPNLFSVANIHSLLSSDTVADIRDYQTLSSKIATIEPDIILHLAAQPLVRKSYIDPIETYSTNVMGTVNLFEAIRKTPSVKAVVNVTTDKCYENQEWLWPYREYEAMGGYDPYSSSKGCSELVTSAFRRSFFSQSGVAIASARAGNVIGGGDWAEDRLIPDFLRAIEANQTLTIRSPNAIRPWQHVLEPLAGYLMLAEKLYTEGEKYASAWNFGPNEEDAKPVSWIVDKLVSSNSGATWQIDQNPQPHEANYLKLDSSKAKSLLSWQPKWRLPQALDKIIEWHNAWQQKSDMQAVCTKQILEYSQYNHID